MPDSTISASVERAPSGPKIDVSPVVDVSVIIVNYNVKDFLSQALRSVYQASEGLSVEVFVVDNNSIDDSVSMVRREYPSVRLMANSENVGFGAANNQAIRTAEGSYLLILNPDTILQEDSLRIMVDFMKSRPDCGALGCQILNPDGTFAPESRRSFPTPQIAFYRMIGLSSLFPRSKQFGRYNLTYLPRDKACEVDALSGSCMMLRREALLGSDSAMNSGSSLTRDSSTGSGLFDEDFFMYGEDLDLCFRIQKAGWKVWYTPDTQIIHYKGESTKKGELKYVKLFYGAMLLFTQKHLEFQHSTALSLLLRAGIVFRAFLSMIGNWARMASPIMKDLIGVYASVSALGTLRFWQTGVDSTPLFFASIGPAFAVCTVLGIALAGGYRVEKKRRIGPVFIGVMIGFMSVASLAYFVPNIAFSRMVVGLSVPLTFVALLILRGVWSGSRRGPRRALLVGEHAEAVRLSNLLSSHPRPPFRLNGYVSEKESENGTVPYLGRFSHLRDLVRLRGFDDIVFASRDIPNHVIFGIMRTLKDLSVQFRMLQEGQEHVIGKSVISHLSLSSLQADVTEVVTLRSPVSKAIFDKFLALLALPFLPLIWISLRMIDKNSPIHQKMGLILKTPQVLTHSISLVGCKPEELSIIPETWNVPIGIFAVTNTMKTEELKPDELARAYWYYVTHQTPGLDLEIILSSFRRS